MTELKLTSEDMKLDTPRKKEKMFQKELTKLVEKYGVKGYASAFLLKDENLLMSINGVSDYELKDIISRMVEIVEFGDEKFKKRGGTH